MKLSLYQVARTMTNVSFFYQHSSVILYVSYPPLCMLFKIDICFNPADKYVISLNLLKKNYTYLFREIYHKKTYLDPKIVYYARIVMIFYIVNGFFNGLEEIFVSWVFMHGVCILTNCVYLYHINTNT